MKEIIGLSVKTVIWDAIIFEFVYSNNLRSNDGQDGSSELIDSMPIAMEHVYTYHRVDDELKKI